MAYTSGVNYIPPTELTEGKVLDINLPSNLNMIKRHYETFDHKFFEQVEEPPCLGDFYLYNLDEINVNVLRLLIKSQNSCSLHLPKELEKFRYLICKCAEEYSKMFMDFKETFVYITIRTCFENYYRNSSDWHIDGFQGTRIARHKPEVNLIWANSYGTEFAMRKFQVQDFDYTKYNINTHFNKIAELDKNLNIFRCEPNQIYMMDPYMIHRAPFCDFSTKRVFVRINFSPVEIPDWTNTVNPMLPMHYEKRTDIRDLLID